MGYVGSSSYEIDLSSFQIGDTLNLQIIHYKGCKPKLLNPYTGHSRPMVFKTLTFASWGNTLVCTSYERKGNGVISIEHFEYNSWVTKQKNPVTPKDTLFTYDLHPFSGINKYRLKYVSENGEVSYSIVKEHDFAVSKLNVNIDKEKKKIFFSEEAEFALLNDHGDIVYQAFAKELDLSELEDGIYYLNADNKTKKIKIRE